MVFVTRFLLLFIFNCVLIIHGHTQSPVFEFASKSSRDSLTIQLKNDIELSLKLPFTDRYYIKHKGAYWAMQLMLYRPAGFDKLIPNYIAQLPNTPTYFQYSFLEMLYTLYPKIFAKDVEKIWSNLGSNKIKAIALEYLITSGIIPTQNLSNDLFQSLHYKCYKQRHLDKSPSPLPTIKQVLDSKIFENEDIIISFQYSDRNKPGFAMLRKANGNWMNDKFGKPLKFKQLARSISNLPYYLTNGNTPQGLYKIMGVDTSDNEFIGPTTNIQIRLPFEEQDSSTYFGVDTNYQTAYNKLLGNLVKYSGLQEAFIAGKLGRSEIIAHGTTINPAYYKGKNYYPCTPSLGCLCTPEIWDDKGRLVESDLQKLTQLILNKTINPSWLLVVNIAGK
jgi:hypothetical protein